MTANKAKPKESFKSASGKRPRKDFPDFRERNHRDRRLGLLGITAAQVDSEARIQPLLKRAGLNTEGVVEILSADPSEEAQKFVAMYRKVPRDDRTRISVEAFAIAAGMTTRRLWEVLCGAAMQQGRDTVALMVSVAQPDVVARTIKQAKTVKGLYDREHLFKAVGFLPVNKGQQIFINSRPVDEKEVEDDTDGTGSLPTMDQFLLDVQQVISPTRALPTSTAKEVAGSEFMEFPAGDLGV